MELRSSLEKFNADLDFCLKTKAALGNINTKRCTQFSFLKPKQFDCVKTALMADTLIVLPTGFGKSLIYELVQIISGTKVIIISPINAIINEQVDRLGDAAVKIDKGIVKQTEQANKETIKQRLSKAMYILGHPEDFIEKSVCDLFVKLGSVSHIFMDEAHCVVSWGSEFRPAFQKVTKLRSIFPSAKVVGMTATATLKMQSCIKDILQMKDACVVSTNPNRENIKIAVKKRKPTVGSKTHVDDIYEDLIMPLVTDLCIKGKDFPKTVIFTSLKQCGLGYDVVKREAMRRNVVEETMPCVSQYHAPSTDMKKKKVASDLRNKEGDIKLLFATEAYGMGADSPDIRRIVHVGPPNSLETYLQEIGRAGRDGNPSSATLYYNASDVAENRTNVKQEVREFCVTDSCRRQFLCSHFGYEKPKPLSELHQCCDNCEKICECDICVMDKLTLTDLTEDTEPLEMGTLKQPDKTYLLNLECTIQTYFDMENHIHGSLYTGLSEELLTDILLNPVKFENESEVKKSFPFLQHIHIKNISSIISQLKDGATSS